MPQIKQVCGKAFGRADLLKRHRANHDDDGKGIKRRRINSSPGAGRVAHACQACAKARVKCEEVKPCSRCRSRNLTCEYASSEAGSAAAMHLLHLSANAHSSAAAATNPTAHINMSTSQGAVPVPPVQGLGPESILSHGAQPGHPQGFHTTAAPVMTNPAHARSTGNSPSVIASNPPINNEAAQLPTPETMIDQSELPRRPCYLFRSLYSSWRTLMLSTSPHGPRVPHFVSVSCIIMVLIYLFLHFRVYRSIPVSPRST